MIKRYISEKELPPYAFVPGYYPHPKLTPEGHLYNRIEKKIEKLIPQNYKDYPEYLYGIDLFNHGYYWESHEEWEGIWNALNKEGITADFLKALIKLSAAGVKVRQRQPDGVHIHAKTANKMFREIKGKVDDDIYAGISLNSLIDFTEEIYTNSSFYTANPEEKKVEVVFEKSLILI